MTSKYLLPRVAILASLGAVAPAQAQHINAVDVSCRSAGTGADQSNCFNLAAKKADADLNVTYRRILGVLKGSDRQKLESAERTWLVYRDQTCAAERDLYEGGTGGLTTYPACLEAVTRHRIDDLKAAYWWRVEKFGG